MNLNRNCYVVDNELHFLLVCPAYNVLAYFQEDLTHSYPYTWVCYDVISDCRATEKVTDKISYGDI